MPSEREVGMGGRGAKMKQKLDVKLIESIQNPVYMKWI